MNRSRMLRLPACWLVVCVLLGSACSNGSGETDQQDTAARSIATVLDGESATSEVLASAVCGWYELEGCVTVAAVFGEPIPLQEALTLVDPWIPVAVYRSEPVCVRIPFSLPNGAVEYEPSDFAYVNAESIRIRRTTTPGAPPITGALVANAYWDHFEAEWNAAQEPGSLFWGVVAYMPADQTDQLASRPGVTEVVEVPSYRTSPNPDPEYLGELYLRNHQIRRGLFGLEALTNEGCEHLGDCGAATAEATSRLDQFLDIVDDDPEAYDTEDADLPDDVATGIDGTAIAEWTAARRSLRSACEPSNKYGYAMSEAILYLEEQTAIRESIDTKEVASLMLAEACDDIRLQALAKAARKTCRASAK